MEKEHKYIRTARGGLYALFLSSFFMPFLKVKSYSREKYRPEVLDVFSGTDLLMKNVLLFLPVLVAGFLLVKTLLQKPVRRDSRALRLTGLSLLDALMLLATLILPLFPWGRFSGLFNLFGARPEALYGYYIATTVWIAVFILDVGSSMYYYHTLKKKDYGSGREERRKFSGLLLRIISWFPLPIVAWFLYDVYQSMSHPLAEIIM